MIYVESPEHPGYWWLAAKWQNLLPACASCKRSRKIDGAMTGKENRFPLEDEWKRALRGEQRETRGTIAARSEFAH